MTVNIGNALRSPIPASACQTWTSPERQDYQPSDWAGAAPYQIITSLPELELFVRSVYIYFGKWILTARNIGLKRKVKFRPRKVHKTPISDRRVFQSRTYSDFQHLGLSSFVEMDTVHFASDSSKTLLTFFYKGKALWYLCFSSPVWIHTYRQEIGVWWPEISGNRFYGNPAYQYLLLWPYAQRAARRSRTGAYHALDDSAKENKLWVSHPVGCQPNCKPYQFFPPLEKVFMVEHLTM